MPIDLARAKIYVFVDGSFANNRDLTSQRGYIEMFDNDSIRDEGEDEAVFTVRGSIIHWSSVKCKRVTRSVLATEIYRMVGGFDTGYIIAHAINTILDRLRKAQLPLMVLMNSYSLHPCLTRLAVTNEKWLMIDFMMLENTYQQDREISEIKWLHGKDNQANTMTKASPNKSLEDIVSNNEATIRLEGWVTRKD